MNFEFKTLNFGQSKRKFLRTKKSSKLYILLLVALFLFTNCALQRSQKSQSEWELTTHPDYHFSVKYPTRWEKNLYGENGYRGAKDVKLTIVQRSGLFSNDGVWVHIKQRPFNEPSLEDVELWANEIIDQDPSKEGIQMPAGYEESLFQDEILDNIPVIRRRYTYSAAPNLIAEEILLPRKHDMLIIHLATTENLFENIYPDFELIVNSFKNTEY